MSENREVILADFQACTGIDDVARAIYILEENNWDFLNAVNKVMPQDLQSFQGNSRANAGSAPEVIEIPSSPVESATDMLSVGNNVPHNSRSMPILDNYSHSFSFPSTSTVNVNGARMIKFNVQYCDRVVTIEVPDTGTVADIKRLLNKELKVATCRQLLSGWARMPQYQNTPLSELSLPDMNALHLTVINNQDFSVDDTEVTERLKGNYILKIRDENADKMYSLNYPGTKTILDVKSDVYSLTNIHVRNQVWSGWPPNIDDNTMLALSGINFPEHDLTLRQIDSDDDEFEDASESFNVEDDCFMDHFSSKRVEPLIPKHVEDEIVGSISFSEQFTNRYGPIHPNFYQGTLEDAVREACNKPSKDRKLLGIYLHHDSSVLSNVFCTQLLGFESVMQLLERNFVLWGWDVTFETNRTRLQTSIMNTLGPMAASSLKNIPVDKLPAIFIIMKIRSSTDIYNIVYGNVGVNELLSSMIEAVEVFSEHQKVEMKEEQERAERELVKWEQDMAYNESLEADRAKEEAKRAQAEAENRERERVENEIAVETARREDHRLKVEQSLPEEPAPGTSNITKIRFRLPTGDNLERRFYINTPLKVLMDYCVVKGYPTEEYKVISSWPRRDLTLMDASKTLMELNLCPQETVILEER
ncbi:PREDICTED: FAS-associated factor 1 isoform X2 [Nicrophorus vespilloides]|uniref:FAS-associated factor 1 isoform X2 n=1 Tax=Nicrophorus vespilloides TaxID=110193 RepID=A0ABM1MKG2_NICVS|nr:PREDICTED: FAS-associated factor 1 isoform X2 [Nicrophorus vespilloides]